MLHTAPYFGKMYSFTEVQSIALLSPLKTRREANFASV